MKMRSIYIDLFYVFLCIIMFRIVCFLSLLCFIYFVYRMLQFNGILGQQEVLSIIKYLI